MDITIIIIFLVVAVLIIAPYFIIVRLLEKIQKQHLDYRLSTINKQVSLQISGNKLAIKPEKKLAHHYKLSPGQIIFFISLPIPPLLVILLASSFYAALMSIAVYFSILGAFYYLIIKIRRRRYTKAFITNLPNSIDLIIRSLRAGRTINDSIKAVGDDTKGPVAEQFRNIIDQISFGKDFVTVTNEISKRLNIPEFSFFVIVLSVQQETGGNVIKTLSSLANMLRQRQLMRMKVKALSSEGIFSAFFMGSLPLFVVGIIEVIRPEYLMLLFTNPTGQHMLIYGIISEIIGCVVIARMVQVDL